MARAEPSADAPPAARGAGLQRAADEERRLWEQFTAAATPEALSRAWLAVQCGIIGDVSAGVLLMGPPDRGPFSPAAVWPVPGRDVKYLSASAERVLAERRGVVLRRAGEAGARDRCEIAYPIDVGGRLHGAVVLDAVPRPEPELQHALRQLQWGFAWLEVLLRRQETSGDSALSQRLQTVLDLVGTLLQHESFVGTATAFVTAAATRLDCDRVSLGLRRRGRMRVRAISHSAHFGAGTSIARLLAEAMEEAADQAAAVVHPPGGRAPRVARAHAELARQQSGAVCTVPLSAGGEVIGALTFERPTERTFDEASIELCEALAAVAGPILDVQRREDRWLPAKAVDAAGQQLSKLVGPRHTALKLTVAGLLIATAFLAFAKGDYRVTARSVMEAGVRRAAVAPFNGYVAQAPARAGDLVRTGQLLCALDDHELRLERLRWLSQAEQFARQQSQALATRNAAQVVITGAQLDQANAQLALAEDQLGRARVLAPFDGVVVTGDLSQSLGTPVERGQVLFEIAPLDSYRLVLNVDERDVGDIRAGQRGRLVLAADPGAPVDFTVETITPVSVAREGRNYFRVEAVLDHLPERLRPGMEGVGKIEVGRRRYVWIWLRPVIDWVRLTVWTWRP